MRRAEIRIALAVAGASLAACGASGHNPGTAAGPIDETNASYHGVRLGAYSWQVTQQLGMPMPESFNPFVPPRATPPDTPADNPYDQVYDDASYSYVDGRVATIVVYGLGAGTQGGVHLGDRLAKVRGLYGGPVKCLSGHGGTDPEDPGCQVTLPRSRFLYFASDPIRVITLSDRPLVPGTPLSQSSRTASRRTAATRARIRRPLP